MAITFRLPGRRHTGGVATSHAQDQRLLDALLDSWDRNNTILVNRPRARPEGGLEASATDGSHLSQRCSHIFTLYGSCSSTRTLPSSPESYPKQSGRSSATRAKSRTC